MTPKLLPMTRSRSFRDDGNGITYNEAGYTYNQAGQTYGGITRDVSGIPKLSTVKNTPKLQFVTIKPHG